MAVLVTAMARTADWAALERLHAERLVACARANGATHYRLYRNAKDAAQALLVAEVPDHEAAQGLLRAAGACLGGLLVGGVSDDRLWEAAGSGGIG